MFSLSTSVTQINIVNSNEENPNSNDNGVDQPQADDVQSVNLGDEDVNQIAQVQMTRNSRESFNYVIFTISVVAVIG